MLKKLLNGVIITIIVALGLSIVGMFVLDGVAQSVIQNKGSEGLGVPIKFGHIHVGVFSHKSSFSDLKIGNPEKYVTDKTPNLLTMKKASVEFSVFQMFDEEAIIPTTTIEGVVLNLQQKDGDSNVEMVINHITADDKPKEPHPQPSFNIETFVIRDITVVASGKFTILETGSVTAHIEEIVLHNVGSGGNTEVATETVTAAITQAIMQNLESHPVEGFSKVVIKEILGVFNGIPGLQQMGDVIQGATDTLGKVLDEILGGIGNLLGGGKK